MQSIARREAQEEKALDDLPRKDDKRPTSVMPPLATVTKATLGNFSGKGRGQARMGFSDLVNTIKN